MASFRPFAYNTGAALTGTFNVGTLAVGTATNIQYFGNYGGVKWFAGPDEDPGYVIAASYPAGNMPTPDGLNDGTVQFWRTKTKTDQAFVDLASFVSRKNGGTGPFADTTEAQTWLTNNNYWYSYSNVSPVTQNLVLHYDPSNTASYSGTGTSVLDLSGNGLTGSMTNVSFTSPSFNFNGSSSTISIADNALLEPGSGDWTMEVWVNHSVITGSSRILFAKTNGGLAADWGYGLRTNSLGGTFGEVGNGTTSLQSNSSTLSINTWYQVVAVWTNLAVNTFELFINGVSQGSKAHSFTSVKNTANPIYIGSFNNGQFSQWLNGKIGIMRLYNTALTSAQVLQNFNADKSKYGL